MILYYNGNQTNAWYSAGNEALQYKAARAWMAEHAAEIRVWRLDLGGTNVAHSKLPEARKSSFTYQRQRVTIAIAEAPVGVTGQVMIGRTWPGEPEPIKLMPLQGTRYSDLRRALKSQAESYIRNRIALSA